MEQQVLDLLVATQDNSKPIRELAERQLEGLQNDDAFPLSLIAIASHQPVSVKDRQAALLQLRRVILKRWSPGLEEFEGPAIPESVQQHIREQLLVVATMPELDRKVINAAAYAVGKIASADFPELWPTLMPSLPGIAPQADAGQLYGILIVLSNLVEDGFDEEQFTSSAVDLLNLLYSVVADSQKNLMNRALAVSVFRACFDSMEQAFQTSQESVQQFLTQLTDAWTPLFIDMIKMPLPTIPKVEESNGARSEWQGAIALKTQVIKVSFFGLDRKFADQRHAGSRQDLQHVSAIALKSAC